MQSRGLLHNQHNCKASGHSAPNCSCMVSGSITEKRDLIQGLKKTRNWGKGIVETYPGALTNEIGNYSRGMTIIRIWFRGPLYYNYTTDPPKIV